jgi:hypothetical protein
MLKKSASRESDGPVSPLCSRNARPQKALVRCAQWGTHPGHPGETSTSMFGRGIVSYLLRPCLGKGASWRAGVGRVRRLDFLSILLTIQVVVSYVLPDSLSHENYVFTQTVSITGVLTL